MDGHHLRLIGNPEDAEIVATRAARNARIDKLGVDRSRYRGIPTYHLSVEAQAPERRLSAERAQVTCEERLQAWRRISALPKATRTR